MTVLISIAPTSLPVGRIGPFEAALPNAPGNWNVTFTKGAVWPASGQVVLATIEESNDNGASWQFSASIDFVGGIWKDRSGATVLTSGWSTTPLYRGPAARIRITIDVSQPCILGAS